MKPRRVYRAACRRCSCRTGKGRGRSTTATRSFQTDPHFRDYVLFYEYFHGDNGAGLGASHQTGWTGLVAKLLQQSGVEPEDALSIAALLFVYLSLNHLLAAIVAS